uniref:Sodium/glutamate symporter n=1 Tax=Solibacter usitatus (strain Ellin6076) TaxID=234267 RepID=Q024M8_SOLUE
MIPTVKISAVQVLGLAALGVVMGAWLKRRVPLLDQLNIPVSILGGMIYAIAALACRDRLVNFDADVVLRDLLMIAFMTTIGLSARLELVRRGGARMLWFLGAATLGAVLQNFLGMGLAHLLGVDPRLGILTGSVSLAGGPATALAFGGTFEKMGVPGATTVAFASATFGITVAGLIGGYIGGRLIRRHKLQPAAGTAAREVRTDGSAGSLMTVVLVLGIAMGAGSLVSAGIQSLGVILPVYIGSMIVAAVLRNLNDHFRFAEIAQPEVDMVGRLALYLFIVMALITLRLWELAHLALPMFAMLAVQVVFCCAMCVTLSWWVMGRNYEAAVSSAGFCGFMLGITANAVACMEELVEKYGPAPQAFLIVPIVGAFLIDFTNSLIITAFANWLK